MKRTQIYFKDWCPYSRRALQLLTDKGVDFEAIAALDRRGELDPILAEPSPGRMPGLFLSRVLLAPVARRPPGYYKL